MCNDVELIIALNLLAEPGRKFIARISNFQTLINQFLPPSLTSNPQKSQHKKPINLQ